MYVNQVHYFVHKRSLLISYTVISTGTQGSSEMLQCPNLTQRSSAYSKAAKRMGQVLLTGFHSPRGSNTPFVGVKITALKSRKYLIPV